MEKPNGIVTCSIDKHVRLWSLDGELWGDINLMKENCDKKWTYPFDWTDKKEKEIMKVKQIVNLIEPQNNKMKEKIIFDYSQ